MDLKSLIKKRPQLPPRILIYTIPGWGKSTLAASMPHPIFLDSEDGLMGMDVDSFPAIEKYEQLEEYMRVLINESNGYKTVVLDTTSSIEKLIWDKVCRDHEKASLEDFGYGKGYVFAMTYWEKLLKGLEILRKKGVAPVLLAHSEVRAFNSPIVDPYDKYILKLHKHAASRLTEWCDNIFFGDHRVTITKSGDGFNAKSKGIGHGERIIYTEERPAFLAKSRMELPFDIEIPKENGWAAIAQHINKPTTIKEEVAA